MTNSRLFSYYNYEHLPHYLAILSLAVPAAILIAFLNHTSTSTTPSFPRTSPDVIFVTLAKSQNIAVTVKRFAKVHLGQKSCIFRMYAATEYDFRFCSTHFHALCIGHACSCRIEVHYLHGLRMWGQLTLGDIAKDTIVIFLRHSLFFTTRALHWIVLAQSNISSFYNRGGRREYIGAAISCYGENYDAVPLWSHSVALFNTTCAFSPFRRGQEDPWIFFSSWFLAHKREWLSWPHVWNHEPALTRFRKDKNNAKRSEKLAKFGERNGMDYSFLHNPCLIWERWYLRWAVEYNLRIIAAESNIAIRCSLGEHGPLESIFPGPMNFRSTRERDIVTIGSVWYEPFDAELGDRYFQVLKDIVERKAKMVSLTLVNKDFVEMAKSWLCNVRIGGFTPPNIFWISLDHESKQALEAFEIGQTVYIGDALIDNSTVDMDLLYGEPAYWKLMLFRTRLIRDLLDRGIDIFIFETDQVWLQDPFKYIRRELNGGAEMVATLDTQQNIAGNLFLVRSLLSTRRMWTEVYQRFKLSYDFRGVNTQERHSKMFVEHDQYHLSDVLLYDVEFTQDYPVALGILSGQLFVGGSWYSGRYTSEHSKRPVIINNNFISGSARKKARAMSFGHWFLHEDGQTCDLQMAAKTLNNTMI